MRPVTLTMRNFGAFRDEITVDFTGVDSFALVGPTGAGKSTVLDAVVFALYGSVPRWNDERIVGTAISSGAIEAMVSLVFEVGGAHYTAVRVVRRTAKGATTKEARLEGPAGELAGTAKELTLATEALLGLNFDQFCKCVLLPQGQFAQFLHDKGSERQDLLVRLLDLSQYQRVAMRAREVARDAEIRIAASQDRLERLGAVTTDVRNDAQRAVERLKAVEGEVRAAEPAVAALMDEARAHRDAAAASAHHAGALAKIVVPAGMADLGARLVKARADLETASQLVAAAETAVKTAEAGVDAAGDVRAAEAALAAHTELSQLVETSAEVAASVGSARAELEQATSAKAAAEQGVAAAQSALAFATTGHLAHELAAGLEAGGPCPVCQQIVTTVPPADESAEGAVTSARSALANAEKVLGQARVEEQRLETAVARLSGRLAALEEQQQALEARVASGPSPATLAATLETAKRASEALVQARRAAVVAVERERDGRGIVAALLADEENAAHDYQEQRDAVVALAPPTRGTAPLLDAWATLASWAATQHADQRQMAQHHAVLADSADKKADELLGGLATTLGVSSSVRSTSELAALAARSVTDAENRLQRIDEELAEAATLAVQVSDLDAERAVAATLGQLLKADQFERWLLVEAIESLVEGASEVLHKLTGGQYSLGTDDKSEFVVIDHRNADERRSVRTLSGGETFQASLALALSLAERVAALAASGGAPLDSIFLDEGFGTLDADSLDTVATTLEALGGDGRMVGVITHVADLAERMPTRFVVSKGPRTSTVERSS